MARCMLSVDVFFVGLAARILDVFQLALFRRLLFVKIVFFGWLVYPFYILGWRYGINGHPGSRRQPNWIKLREKVIAHFESVMNANY